MRSLSLFPIIVATGIVAVIVHDRVDSNVTDIAFGGDHYSQRSDRSDTRIASSSGMDEYHVQFDGQKRQTIDAELLLDLVAYEDADYGFSVAIPAGWNRIVTAESDQSFAELEPGYAIGFESPYQGGDDRFADYLLIEVLPGRDSGLFETDGKNRRNIVIDGHSGWVDRLDVDGISGGLTEVDLTIFQAQMSGVGYTIGLYAIGEPSRERLMSDAFEVIVRTFRQTTPPFPTS